MRRRVNGDDNWQFCTRKELLSNLFAIKKSNSILQYDKKQNKCDNNQKMSQQQQHKETSRLIKSRYTFKNRLFTIKTNTTKKLEKRKMSVLTKFCLFVCLLMNVGAVRSVTNQRQQQANEFNSLNQNQNKQMLKQIDLLQLDSLASDARLIAATNQRDIARLNLAASASTTTTLTPKTQQTTNHTRNSREVVVGVLPESQIGLLSQSQLGTCGYPGSPAHASVSFSASPVVSGTAASYTCDNGYELLGPPRRVCQANGTWAPIGIPFCGK